MQAVANVPGFVEKIFLTKEYNGVGIFALNIYSLGVQTTIVVDDFLPHISSSTKTAFAHVDT